MTAAGPMVDHFQRNLREHLTSIGSLDSVLPRAAELADLLITSIGQGKCVYTFGNGGSAAEAQHFAAELVGRYRLNRSPLAAVCLAGDSAVLTCIGNDFGFDQIFARQLVGLAHPGDVAVGFSTTGHSANVVAGLAAARRTGATTVLISSGDGGGAAQYADLTLLVLAAGTARVQESHQLLMHMISEAVDEHVGGPSTNTRITSTPEGWHS